MVTIEVHIHNLPGYSEFVQIDDTLHDDFVGIASGLVAAEYQTDQIIANVIYSANCPNKLREIQRGIWY